MFHIESLDLAKLDAADLASPPKGAASRQIGHGKDIQHRGSGYGVVTTYIPPPVTGAKFPSDQIHHTFHLHASAFNSTTSPYHNWGTAIPPMEFPQFDGRNPKMWQRRCENYFELYNVPTHMWIKMATMNFIHSAAFWLHSVEDSVRNCTWKELCHAVNHRFHRDQHNFLVRQFFHISQIGSVPEYIEQFDDLVHKLKAHDTHFDPILITNRFVDGLRHDIRAIIMMHKPLDLDTASSLAMLQEELNSDGYKKDQKKNERNFGFSYVGKSMMPLNQSPLKT